MDIISIFFLQVCYQILVSAFRMFLKSHCASWAVTLTLLEELLSPSPSVWGSLETPTLDHFSQTTSWVRKLFQAGNILYKCYKIVSNLTSQTHKCSDRNISCHNMWSVLETLLPWVIRNTAEAQIRGDAESPGVVC